jgi:type I restriction enzyme R subunit
VSTNFAHLRRYDEQLFRLGSLAERYFPDDPNTALIKLRQLGERLAQQVASRFGAFTSAQESQLALIRRLEFDGLIEREVAALFHDLRTTGNDATHGLQGDHASALSTLKIAWQLGVWFHRTFSDPEFRSGPFRPPQPPADESEELRAELASLQRALDAFRAEGGAVAEQLSATEAQLQQALDEQLQWEQLAEAAEADKVALAAQLQALQNAAARQPAAVSAGLLQAAKKAAGSIELDEASTRQLIDEQLRQAGWEADTQTLRYGKGARPKKNRNLAIAEWPTSSGPADYVLFVGLTPYAAVEAKRANSDVAGKVPQAERYCRDFQPSGETELRSDGWGPEAEYRIPFAFSSNGRPFLNQLRTKSGANNTD